MYQIFSYIRYIRWNFDDINIDMTLDNGTYLKGFTLNADYNITGFI